MLLSLQIGFSCVRAEVACAILKESPVLRYHLKQLLQCILSLLQFNDYTSKNIRSVACRCLLKSWEDKVAIHRKKKTSHTD